MNQEYHQHTGGKQQRKTRYRKPIEPEDLAFDVEEEKGGPMDGDESESQLNDLDQEQASESSNSLFEFQSESQKSEGPLVKDQIVKLTDNFKLAYRDIRQSQMLREAPLNLVTIDRIKVLIKNGRRQAARLAKEALNLNLPKSGKTKHKLKRQAKEVPTLSEEVGGLKRPCLTEHDTAPQNDYVLARQLIANFDSIDYELQSKILCLVENHIQTDKQLLRLALGQQVSLHVHKARLLFEQRKLGPLQDLLTNLIPAAAIILNVEISLVNQSYTEESATLSRTLLPFIDQVTDYSFLGPESSFIASRFLASLILHIKDTQSQVSVGLVQFALHLNPRALKSVITLGGGIVSLQQALREKGFLQSAVNAMCLHPDKFLWPDLFVFWKDKSSEVVNQSAQILARVDVLTDPGEQMEHLVIVLAQRSLLAKCLLQVDRIRMPLTKLVRILEKLAPLESETIQACLQEDSTKWEQTAIQSSNLDETNDQKLSLEQVTSFYNEETAGLAGMVPLQSMIEVSKAVSSDLDSYRHSELQAAIAGVVLSHNQDFTIVVSPTGSGKTWIQGLIAKYFCNQGRKVVVVEPNENLMRQTAEKLALVDYAITVTSIQKLYEEGPWHQVVILNEFDLMFQDSSYFAFQKEVKGLWQFKGKTVIAFSATSSQPYERLVNNCITRPKTLKFKSEYELVQGVNPISEPTVVQCSDMDQLYRSVIADIEKRYDNQPMIIITEVEQRDQLKNLLSQNKFKFIESSTANYLEEVRQWDYGLLLLNREEGRGVDTRFKKASHVMILTQVTSYHELVQMIGRSSRTRGVCEGTLFSVGQERSNQVIERLKRHGVITMQELERLLKLVEKRNRDAAVIRRLNEAKENGESIQSIETFKRGIDQTTLNRILKGVFD